jgi:FMN phosphatase YigB (HAD superfamily)
MLNTILFDLDGTLLSIDHKQFERIYFGGLASHFTDMYPPDKLIQLILESTKAMVADLSERTNEVVFMETLEALVQDRLSEMQRRFKRFYENDFDRLKEAVVENVLIQKTISILKAKGYQLVIATNPMFPKIAIEKRIGWTGLNRSDFSYVTSFETNHYCKPQTAFFAEILNDIKKSSEECLMVGNDAQEDMAAKTYNIKTYLITDYLIHRHDGPVSADYQGSYMDFLNFVQDLPNLG